MSQSLSEPAGASNTVQGYTMPVGSMKHDAAAGLAVAGHCVGQAVRQGQFPNIALKNTDGQSYQGQRPHPADDLSGPGIGRGEKADADNIRVKPYNAF